MVKKAEELAKQHDWFLAHQFENPANPAFHRQTTEQKFYLILQVND
jgi:cysteine synthase A